MKRLITLVTCLLCLTHWIQAGKAPNHYTNKISIKNLTHPKHVQNPRSVKKATLEVVKGSLDQYFVCPECGDVFQWNSTHQEHINSVHKHKRPFTCPYSDCNSTFTTKGNLKKHINMVHKKKKPFTCPYQGCNTTFFEKTGLNDHIESVHEKKKTYLHYLSKNI